MAIDTTGSLIGTPNTISGAERRARLQLRASQAAADGNAERRRAAVAGLGPTVKAPASRESEPRPIRTIDLAELSRGALAVGGVLAAEAANTTLGRAGEEGEAQGQAGGALVESFIRQRAIFAYRSPQTSQGQFDFTLDVEVAYRVIQYVPGGTLDTQA
jgi:hypothetical protein